MLENKKKENEYCQMFHLSKRVHMHNFKRKESRWRHARIKKKNILKFWQLKNTKRISNVNYLNIRNFCLAGNDVKFNEFLENQMAHLSKYLLSLREIFPVRKQCSVFHTDESAELRIQVKSRLICPCRFIQKCCCCCFFRSLYFALLQWNQNYHSHTRHTHTPREWEETMDREEEKKKKKQPPNEKRDNV